jgi:3-methyladenine DNA glycosylase Mpg
MQKLPRRFYNRETAVVARDLLGKFLIREASDGRERQAFSAPGSSLRDCTT